MASLSVKIREDKKIKPKTLRQKEILPAVLYGPGIKNLNLEVNLKDFEKVLKEAGESSLINLSIEGKKQKFLVLIHDIQSDPVSGKPSHADFYQPKLEEEIEAHVPLVFEGEAPAVKDFGGTLVKKISEIEVKALPQHLPKEIRVDISNLKTFNDHILVKDLKLPEGVKISRKPEEIIVSVAQPEKVEEELEKPIEEKVEEVEKIEEKKGKEEIEETEETKEEEKSLKNRPEK